MNPRSCCNGDAFAESPRAPRSDSLADRCLSLWQSSGVQVNEDCITEFTEMKIRSASKVLRSPCPAQAWAGHLYAAGA